MFEGWLRITLHQRFDHALDEPLSEELAAILETVPDQGNEH